MEKAFDVSSVVVDYVPAVPLESWPSPTGGFRLAAINGFDLEKCMVARQIFQNICTICNNQKTVEGKTWMKDGLRFYTSMFPSLLLLCLEAMQSVSTVHNVELNGHSDRKRVYKVIQHHAHLRWCEVPNQ